MKIKTFEEYRDVLLDDMRTAGLLQDDVDQSGIHYRTCYELACLFAKDHMKLQNLLVLAMLPEENA